MKELLGGKQMAIDEVKETITEWLNELTSMMMGLSLVQCLDKCLNSTGDYVEK
jgi:hypothetical protein